MSWKSLGNKTGTTGSFTVMDLVAAYDEAIWDALEIIRKYNPKTLTKMEHEVGKLYVSHQIEKIKEKEFPR